MILTRMGEPDGTKRWWWKVPFRQVYCESVRQWLKAVAWIFFVMKVFPDAVDLGSDALLGLYVGHPSLFAEQYRGALLRANARRRGISYDDGLPGPNP